MTKPTIDLEAYLARIHYHGRRCVTPPVLSDMHEAHVGAIPFENVDVLLRRPIRLDWPSLEAKLVHGQRGGYCFEQNELFAAALEADGFKVTRLAARVRYRSKTILPRTHMVLRVNFGNEAWLADVGFGGEGPLRPIRMRDGEIVRQSFWTYRLAIDHGVWVLRLQRGAEMLDLYSFTEEPQLSVDYEPPNWFVSTHPDSIFVRSLTVQRSKPAERIILRNYDLTIDHGGTPQTQRLASHAQLVAVLREQVGLNLPADLQLPELHDPFA